VTLTNLIYWRIIIFRVFVLYINPKKGGCDEEMRNYFSDASFSHSYGFGIIYIAV